MLQYIIFTLVRLRWSRVSVLAFGTQVCWFKPGRSRRIFQGEKILSTLSFGGEEKPFVPCVVDLLLVKITECYVGVGHFRQNSSAICNVEITYLFQFQTNKY